MSRVGADSPASFLIGRCGLSGSIIDRELSMGKADTAQLIQKGFPQKSYNKGDTLRRNTKRFLARKTTLPGIEPGYYE